MAKIVFFQAHPDDLEYYCSNLLYYLSTKSKKNHDIQIASMTRGEFGLFGYKSEAFKGERLGRIRTHELYRAQKIYGITPEKIHFFNIFDGSVKLTRKIIKNVVDYLNENKPDIVFAPEARWTFYTHRDHINTGRILYYVINNNLIEKIPKLYYYTSITPNFRFPFNKEGIKLRDKLLACHTSQKKLIENVFWLRPLLRSMYGRKVPGWKYAEGYRRVYFGDKTHLNEKPTLSDRILSRAAFSTPLYHLRVKIYTIDEEKIKKQSHKK